MGIFVNRVLNLKKMEVIGFDMDYTLVRYDTEVFEELTHRMACARLVSAFAYPKEVLDLEFDGKRSIGGLVEDRRRGNLLKLSRFGKVKTAYHGLEELDYHQINEIYQEMTIDLRDEDYHCLDTAFAISNGVMFGQLVELKKQGVALPDYPDMADQINQAVDGVHRDGSLKAELRKDFARYVIQDPKVAWTLERFKKFGKKLMIITNSDYCYTRDLLNYALNPHLKNHQDWRELFDVVITLAGKPRFFEGHQGFMKIENDEGHMSNYEGSVATGIYQGGWFGKLQEDLGVPGNHILYLGDHIYGDVVSIKKRCNWRTALVLEDLAEELQGQERAKPVQQKVDELMAEKSSLEERMNQLDLAKYNGEKISRKELNHIYEEQDRLNHEISQLLGKLKEHFNPYWGEVLRAGSEESRFADQLERYACIYMTRVSDLYEYSTRTYFRPKRRLLPHEE